MTDNIVSIDVNAPHECAEVICVACRHRWIGVWPAGKWLKDLECPECHVTGYVICTGQVLEDEGEYDGEYL